MTWGLAPRVRAAFICPFPFCRIAFNLYLYVVLVTLEQQHVPLRVLEGGARRIHSAPKTSRRDPAPNGPRRSVLYIGADQDCRIMLSRIVRRLESTQLEVASNGREGRLMIRSRTPNLIVIDSDLADCDARDLMIHLGRAALRTTLPFVVVSADEDARLRFIRAGAVSFMTKPLRVAEIERSMMNLLELFSVR